MHGDKADTAKVDTAIGALAAKVDAFALTLSAPEQVLLAELISGGEDSPIVGFGSRPIWPGLVHLVSSGRLQFGAGGAGATGQASIRDTDG